MAIYDPKGLTEIVGEISEAEKLTKIVGEESEAGKRLPEIVGEVSEAEKLTKIVGEESEAGKRLPEIIGEVSETEKLTKIVGEESEAGKRLPEIVGEVSVAENNPAPAVHQTGQTGQTDPKRAGGNQILVEAEIYDDLSGNTTATGTSVPAPIPTMPTDPAHTYTESDQAITPASPLQTQEEITRQETKIAAGSDTDSGPAITPASSNPASSNTVPNTVPEQKNNDVAIKKEITIVLAGKSGAGKSTLLKNVFGIGPNVAMSASEITKHLETYEAKKNDIVINIVDTVGFMESNKKKQLKNISKHVSGKADLLVYCLPIGPGLKFHDSNPEIMKCLQNAFGKDIWQHCMVVLTFSNLAWNIICMQNEEQETGKTNDEAAIAEYKRYIGEYIDKFKQQLGKLGVKNVQVASALDDNFNPNAGIGTITVVPAGYKPSDKVLTGLRYMTKPNQAASKHATDFTTHSTASKHATDSEPASKRATDFTTHSESVPHNKQNDLQTDNDRWTAVLVFLILQRCKPECSLALLQFWYGRKRIGAALKEQGVVNIGLGGGMAGGVAGGAAGAAAGAAMGVVGGPIGVPIGAALGLVTGVVVGTLVGGGSSAGTTAVVGHVLDKTA